MTFKQRLIRLTLWMTASFLLLFLARLASGYITTPDGMEREQRITQEIHSSESMPVGKRNYASSQHQFTNQPSSGKALAPTLDQKYEKTATLQAASSAFTEDEQKVRKQVAEYNGIIQYENGKGTQGNRLLYLHIGVQPMRFDEFYRDLQAIGRVLAADVSKTDKTNEFLALNAKRASLEKTRASLMELKSHQGKIEEFMSLQSRLLDIENELQSLGVQLGDFDEVNAFCTVKFSLREEHSRLVSISLPHRVKVALYWTIELYTGVMFFLFGTMLTAFIVLLAVDKFNMVRKATALMNERQA